MSVFGSSYPEFYSTVVNPTTTIELQHSILVPNWGISNLIEHQSIINGVKGFTVISADHAIFTVVVNIWKYGSPATTMDTMLGYIHDTVYFKLHTDGNYVQKAAGGSAKFFITKMKPMYVSNEPPVLYDKLLIEFVSLDPISAQDTI